MPQKNYPGSNYSNQISTKMNNKTAESNLKSNEIKSNPKKMRLDLNKLQKKSSRE